MISTRTIIRVVEGQDIGKTTHYCSALDQKQHSPLFHSQSSAHICREWKWFAEKKWSMMHSSEDFQNSLNFSKRWGQKGIKQTHMNIKKRFRLSNSFGNSYLKRGLGKMYFRTSIEVKVCLSKSWRPLHECYIFPKNGYFWNENA